MHAFLAKFVVIFIASATLLASAPAHTQAYPTRPIKIVVPFAPGGGSDFIARFIAQRLGTALGQPVIVDNRPGAGGTVGIDAGLASPADGYTIIQLSQGPMVVANPGFCATTAGALPQIAGGKSRAIAVTTSTRLPALPDVPTIAESGLPGYDVTIWHGLIGPKGMPKETLNQNKVPGFGR